ncbi:hypothetical protein B0H17DRAFT_1265354 [Mycena rosella]|uniref:Uncharacterized protein n=1 Tax=Mycena rosella TaxID=1033263 RepID=A0AAD7CP53_MYCRO|nr:hypothetical protein B0H17DRAFT_1265354 [Mycena rosella]
MGYHDFNCSNVLPTDTTWLSGNTTAAAKFLSMADSALFATFTLGKMGDQPWGPLTDTSDALAAVQVPVLANNTLPPTSTGGGSSSSSTSSDGHAIPIALIVGPIVGGLVLVFVGLLVVFWWLRRQNVCQPFIMGNPGDDAHIRTSSVISLSGLAAMDSQSSSLVYGVYTELYPNLHPKLLQNMEFVSGHPHLHSMILPTQFQKEDTTTWQRNAAAGPASNTLEILSEKTLKHSLAAPDPPPSYSSIEDFGG